MEELRKRRGELERKETQLQESLVKFDRFLKENDARRDRAERKRREEEALILKRIAEMEELQDELAQLTARRVQNKVLLARNAKFEGFLKGVVAHSSEPMELDDIIARHSALTTTNDDLRRREAATHAAMDALKRETAEFKEEHRVHMLNCNNHLAALLAKREEAETSAVHWENRFGEVQSTATTRTLLLGQIKMCAVPGRARGMRVRTCVSVCECVSECMWVRVYVVESERDTRVRGEGVRACVCVI